MKLLIKKRNLSKHDIIHSTAVMGGKAFSQSDITVVIRDSNGNAVKETPLGREMHGTGPHHPESGSVFNGRTILKSGDVIQLETKANREQGI